MNLNYLHLHNIQESNPQGVISLNIVTFSCSCEKLILEDKFQHA